MRGIKSILLVSALYTGAAMLANPAMADMSAIADLREGDMRKLMFHDAPEATSDVAFLREDGSEMTLADLQGKITVLNFWATWCAPCRAEMPGLSALESSLGGDDFQVITIATGRNPRPAMERFFTEIEVDNLPLHADPKQALARSMGVLGLPITVILDRDGMEIARLQGDAHWDSESAMAIVSALIAAES